MVNIFEIRDYRRIVEAFISDNKTERAYRTKLAQAAGCHLSYLTRVLNEECELTPDHAYGISQYWELDDKETEYFLTTLNMARAATPGLKRRYQTQLEIIVDENNDLKRQTGLSRTTDLTADLEYYGTWYCAAVHLLTAVPGFQTPQALAEKLRLDVKLVNESLEKLVQMKVVTREKSKFVCARGGLHVPRGSALAWLHLSNWRHRALANAQHPSSDLHFTSIYSLSKADAELLKKNLVKYISASEALLAESPDETVVAVNLDFFEV